MKKISELLPQKNSDNSAKPKKPINKEKVKLIISLSVLILAHIFIVLAIVLSFRYYAIYPSLFGSIVAIVVCILIIADIIFFVGFNHKDLALKVISLILAGSMLLGGTVGTYLIAKANGIVNSVLDSSKNETKYETFSGVFVCYDKGKTFNSIDEINKNKVGFLSETSNGITYIADGILKEAKVDYTAIYFNTNSELIQALIDEEVDAIAITSAYREIYSLERDENSPFAAYLDHFIDFDQFVKELKIDTGKKAKNLSTDPFNVLLIGYSRTDIGSPIGLADSIILASINPQTYTVSMMSIARDSFVPINCYGGEYDKINSGRSTSRACFIDTVEDFINTGRSEKDRIDIDYYMELDYYGLVYMVNAIGGITVNNPVDFELDGTFVPAGENVFCDGIMALQFCRERHHMPNGDFDRQQHQKEVIIEIAKKFVNSGNITLALKAMEAASEWMSTDMTLEQLTTVFNLLLNTKNYTTLNTFDLVDFQTLRITGEGGIKYYSYSMHLPLWVYLIYQGSFDESMTHMEEVLGKYDTINQTNNFEYSCIAPYVRPDFYSLSYEDKFMFTPDPMPAYWANLEGMSSVEAMQWASENGVKLTIAEIIPFGDSRYNSELEGKVCDQSVRYGSLISDYNSGTITIMGNGDVDMDDYFVPDFVGKDVSKVISWATDHDITVSGTNGITSGRVVASQDPEAGTSIKDVTKISVTLKAPSRYTVSFNSDGGSTCSSITVEQGSTYGSLPTPIKTGFHFAGWYTGQNGTGTRITSTTDVTISTDITIYAHWTTPTYTYYDADHVVIQSSTTREFTGTIPTKEGQTFVSWYESEDETTGDVSFTPVFQPNTTGGGSSDSSGSQGSGGSGSSGSQGSSGVPSSQGSTQPTEDNPQPQGDGGQTPEPEGTSTN